MLNALLEAVVLYIESKINLSRRGAVLGTGWEDRDGSRLKVPEGWMAGCDGSAGGSALPPLPAVGALAVVRKGEPGASKRSLSCVLLIFERLKCFGTKEGSELTRLMSCCGHRHRCNASIWMTCRVQPGF